MPEPPNVDTTSYIPLEKTGLLRGAAFKSIGSAYALEQATFPSTIGFNASASPLALLPWIAEKFLSWSDTATQPSLDAILESVTPYYLTDTSLKEIVPVPKSWVETTGDFVWWKEHSSGGHFAALERPEVLEDLTEFVGKVWEKAKAEFRPSNEW